jgi:hypothetical protein
LLRHRSLRAKGQRRASGRHGSMANPNAGRGGDYFAKCHLRDRWGSLTLARIFLRKPIQPHGLHSHRTGLQWQNRG